MKQYTNPVVKLQDEKKTLELEIARLSVILNKHQEDSEKITSLTAKVKKVEDKLAKLEQDESLVSINVSELFLIEASLATNVEALKKELSSNEVLLGSQSKTASKELEKAQEDTRKVKEALAVLKDQVKAEKAELKTSEDKKVELDTQITGLVPQIEALTESVKKKKEAVKSLENDVEALESDKVLKTAEVKKLDKDVKVRLDKRFVMDEILEQLEAQVALKKHDLEVIEEEKAKEWAQRDLEIATKLKSLEVKEARIQEMKQTLEIAHGKPIKL